MPELGLAWAAVLQQEAQLYCICCLALAMQELPVPYEHVTLDKPGCFVADSYLAVVLATAHLLL